MVNWPGITDGIYYKDPTLRQCAASQGTPRYRREEDQYFLYYKQGKWVSSIEHCISSSSGAKFRSFSSSTRPEDVTPDTWYERVQTGSHWQRTAMTVINADCGMCYQKFKMMDILILYDYMYH